MATKKAARPVSPPPPKKAVSKAIAKAATPLTETQLREGSTIPKTGGVPTAKTYRIVVNNGITSVSWPVYRYRVLFSDGEILDVETPDDHSGIREVIRMHHGRNSMISGVVRLECVGWTLVVHEGE